MKLIIDIDEDYYKAIWENGYIYDEDNEDIAKIIKDGTPLEEKIGHWIYDDEYSDCFDVTYKCSCCKREIIIPYEARNEVYKEYPYCHCGAKMEGE